MNERTRELLMPVEALIFGIVMLVVYLYILQPILVDINPIFAYSTDGFRHGPRTVGELMLYVTVIGSWFLYGAIRYMISYSPKLLFANLGRVVLFLIPNRVLPNKYQPENMDDLQELEERYE